MSDTDPASSAAGPSTTSTWEETWSRLAYEQHKDERMPSDEAYVAKTALVQRIAEIFEAGTSADENKSPVFTGWHMGLFYNLPVDVLNDIINSPEEIRALGDKAKAFVMLVVQGRGAVKPRTRGKLEAPPTEPESDAPFSPLEPRGSSNTEGEGIADKKLRRRSSATALAKSVKTAASMPMAGFKTLRGKFSASKMDILSEESHSEEPHSEEPRPSTAVLETKKRKRRPTARTIPPLSDEAKGKQPAVAKQPAATKPATIDRDKPRLDPTVDSRDKRTCVVTGTKGVFDRAHIVPFAVNSSAEAADAFVKLLDLPLRMFGKTLSDILKPLFGSPGSSNEAWNIITLNPYIHRLFDSGLVALEPLYIEEKKVNQGLPAYNAAFAFHWVQQNSIHPNRREIPKFRDGNMFIASDEFERIRDGLVVYRVSGDRIQDGKVFQIRHASRASAESMLHAMAIRWVAGLMWRLAGAAGLSSDVNFDDDDEIDRLKGYTHERYEVDSDEEYLWEEGQLP